MQTVIDNILINYEIYGHKKDNVILILHGWNQNITHWVSVAKILSVKYRVITVDLPGFGSSTIPEKTFSTKDYSKLIEVFIKKLDLKDTILIGHSFGGKVAIKIASNLKNITKLFLIAPSGIGEKPILTKLKIRLYKLLNLFLFWLPKNLEMFKSKYFYSNDYYNSGEMRNIFKKVVDEKVETDASRIAIPSIIIWGENDNELKIKNAKLLRNLITESTLRVVWKSGHSPNIEAPESLASIIKEYL